MRLLILLVFNEMTAIFVQLPVINGYKKNQRAVYEWVNISDDLVYEWVSFFKGQVYERGRFRNTGLHTHTKLFLLPPPPPTPRGRNIEDHKYNCHRDEIIIFPLPKCTVRYSVPFLLTEWRSVTFSLTHELSYFWSWEFHQKGEFKF